MDFYELEKVRYAVREYEDKVIEEEKLQRILESARIAPTAANRQPQRLYLIHKEDMKRYDGAIHFHGAAMAIVVCAKTSAAWVRGYDQMNASVIDASIVCTHMMMEATQLGLGSLWVCAFDPEKMKLLCGLEEDVVPIHVLCLGYATQRGDTTRFDTTRKPLCDILLNS